MFLDFVGFLNSKLFKYLITIVLIAILAVIMVLLHRKDKTKIDKSELIKRLSIISIFSALSIILYMFNVPITIIIPFMPSFLEVHFSLIPIIVIVALYGPSYGAIGIIIRTLGKFLFKPSTSFGVGELADVIIGLATIIVFFLIYKKDKSNKSLFLALLASFAVWIFTAVLINWTIIVPFYVQLLFKGNLSPFLGLLEKVPGIDASNYMRVYLFVVCLPFNAIAAGANTLLAYFLIIGLKRTGVVFEGEKINWQH